MSKEEEISELLQGITTDINDEVMVYAKELAGELLKFLSKNGRTAYEAGVAAGTAGTLLSLYKRKMLKLSPLLKDTIEGIIKDE